MKIRRNLQRWCATALAAVLVACGGGASDDRVPVPGTLRMGASGGTVSSADGASVEVPAGALAAEATVSITRDGTGAPALPEVAKPASAVYQITPHGGDFLRYVTVSIPVSMDEVPDGAQLVMITAEPGETTWRVLSSATLLDGVMRAAVMQFSFFQIVSLPAVRMPVLQTQIHRLTNAAFPGVQQVPAGTEIAGQVPLRGLEAESRLSWQPVYSLSSGRLAPRACLPSDYGPGGIRWSGLRDGAAWQLSTSHGRLWLPKVLVGADAWPRSFADAMAASVFDTNPFAATFVNDPNPLAGFGALHFYGQGTPRTGAKVEAVAGDIYYLPPSGNQAEDDHISWYGRINLTAADNGRVRLDAVVDTDCGFAVQAAPLSFQLNLTGFAGYLGGVTPRPDVWGTLSRTFALGTWGDLVFDVNQEQTIAGGGSFGEPAVVDPLRWTEFQVVTSVSMETSSDGRVWVARPDLSSQLVATPVTRPDGTPLPYLSSYRLPLTDLTPQQAGFYRVFACTRWLEKDRNAPLSALVERSSGCGAYGAFAVEVVGVPPTVTRQPQSQTMLVGERATLSVTGDGFAAPSVQWQIRSFADAFLGRPWVNIAGATAASYSTPALTLADHPTYYRALLNNASGTVASDVATVSVVEQLAPPVFVGQPGSLNVNVGGTAVFAATASGAGPFSYQWRRNGVAVTGANTSVLTLSNVTALNDGQYTLAVTNRVGTTVSEPAALVVTLGTPVALPPTLANQPSSLTVPEGSAANFAVAVTGTGPYTYAWYRAGTPSPIADTPVLAFASVAAGDAGNYTVRVTNTVGTVLSSTATLAVTTGGGGIQLAPAIVTPPAAVAAFPGAEAVFVVAATGSGPLAYQWRFGGNDIPGATSAVLSLPAVTGANAGQYSVEVRNSAGAVLSGAAPLLVIGAPAIVTAPAGTSAVEGGTAAFQVAATGDLLRYQWTRNAVAIDGATASSYTTPTLALADSGAVYAVIVYNGAGLAISSSAVLTVAAAPPPPGLQQTTLASVTNTGGVPDNASGKPTLSSNGRRVAFTSEGSNLVAGAAVAGGAYVRDLDAGTTVQVDRTLAGAASSRRVGEFVKISGNGRHVVFTSDDPELVAGDTNGGADVFVRDLQLGSTVRVNVRFDGAQVDANGNGTAVDISADGRFVLFQSAADLGGSGSALPNGYRWFVRDLQLGSLVSIPEFDGFNGAVLSGDGQHAAVLDVDAGFYRVRVFDQGSGVRTVLSIPAGDGFVGGRPALSHDGRHVAFLFRSATLVGGLAASANQIGVVDTQAIDPAATLELASRTAGGLSGDGGSEEPQLSADGRYVLFASRAPLLTDGVGQPCCGPAVVVRDRVANTTRVASRSATGTPIAPSGMAPAISGDGGTVAFGADIAAALGGGALGGGQVFVAPRP